MVQKVNINNKNEKGSLDKFKYMNLWLKLCQVMALYKWKTIY